MGSGRVEGASSASSNCPPSELTALIYLSFDWWMTQRIAASRGRMAQKKRRDAPHVVTTSWNRIMSKEAPLSVAERDFILEALREDVRIDGRGPDQFRPLSLSFGDEYGHVKLQLGKTRFVHSIVIKRFCVGSLG